MLGKSLATASNLRVSHVQAPALKRNPDNVQVDWNTIRRKLDKIAIKFYNAITYKNEYHIMHVSSHNNYT